MYETREGPGNEAIRAQYSEFYTGLFDEGGEYDACGATPLRGHGDMLLQDILRFTCSEVASGPQKVGNKTNEYQKKYQLQISEGGGGIQSPPI